MCLKQFGSTHRENSSFAEEMTIQDEVVYTENSLISSGEMVLMQTAKADIKNPESDIKQETCILLDSSSQDIPNRVLSQKVDFKTRRLE